MCDRSVRRGVRGFEILFVLSLVAMFTSGCAFWGEPTPPGFDRVALDARVEKDDEGKLEGDLHADTTVKNSLIGGVSGAGTAAVVGAGAGFLASGICGPFAPACAPPLMLFFAGVAAPVGFVGGAIIGGIGGLPWETTTEVNAVLDKFHQRDLRSELQTEFEVSVPRWKQVRYDDASTVAHESGGNSNAPAQAVVTARIDEFDLHQHYSERLSMSINASMIQDWDRNTQDPKQKTCSYEFRTPKRDVEDWLLEDGKAFRDAATEGVGKIASWMARDLEAFASQIEREETEEAPRTCFRD